MPKGVPDKIVGKLSSVEGSKILVIKKEDIVSVSDNDSAKDLVIVKEINLRNGMQLKTREIEQIVFHHESCFANYWEFEIAKPGMWVECFIDQGDEEMFKPGSTVPIFAVKAKLLDEFNRKKEKNINVGKFALYKAASLESEKNQKDAEEEIALTETVNYGSHLVGTDFFETAPPLPRTKTMVENTPSGDNIVILQEGTALMQGINIEKKLGMGGSASVYRAYTEPIEIFETYEENGVSKMKKNKKRHYFAVKLLHPHLFTNEKERMRFFQEFELTTRLNHSHIGRTFTIFGHNQLLYYTMQLYKCTIFDRHKEEFEKNGGIAPDKLYKWLAQIHLALKYVHRKNILHLDLKPTNVMLDDNGDAVLVDFGIAKEIAVSRTTIQSTAFMGTPYFMAPEQLFNSAKLGPYTDVFSLGKMLWLFLTNEAEIGRNRLEEFDLPEKTLNFFDIEALDEVITDATHKSIDKRIQTTEAFISRLAVCCKEKNNYDDKEINPMLNGDSNFSSW